MTSNNSQDVDRRPGGPKFLVIVGSCLLMLSAPVIWAAASAVSELGGSDGGTGKVVAAVIFIAGLASIYAALQAPSRARYATVLWLGTSGATLVALLAVGGSAGWLFGWAVSGGLIGLGALLERGGRRQPHQVGGQVPR